MLSSIRVARNVHGNDLSLGDVGVESTIEKESERKCVKQKDLACLCLCSLCVEGDQTKEMKWNYN